MNARLDRHKGTTTLRVGEVLAAPSSGYVSVRVDGGTLDLPLLRGYTPTVGDTCLVAMQGPRGFVLGALGTAPPGADPVDYDVSEPPAEEPVSGSILFVPTFTGSWRNGAWRDTSDLYQGDGSGVGRNFGAAYYGETPSSLEDAIPTGLAVTVRRLSAGPPEPVSPTFRLLPDLDPAGDPIGYLDTAPTTPALTVGTLTTFDLPAAWAEQLVDGTAGGIGIYVATDSPYVRLDGSHMELRMDWRR